MPNTEHPENEDITKEGKQAQNVFKEESQAITKDEKKTMSGLDENIAGMLCYVFSIVTGIIFLVIEKDNRFIRFHAMQAIFTFLFIFGIFIILNLIPILGTIISILVSPLSLVLVVFLMYQAYKGRMYKLPFIGDLAEKNSIPK